MGATDSRRGYPFEPDVYIDADILVMVYHLPMEIFVHLAGSGIVASWVDDDGTLMLECNGIVALLGEAGYTGRN